MVRRRAGRPSAPRICSGVPSRRPSAPQQNASPAVVVRQVVRPPADNEARVSLYGAAARCACATDWNAPPIARARKKRGQNLRTPRDTSTPVATVERIRRPAGAGGPWSCRFDHERSWTRSRQVAHVSGSFTGDDSRRQYCTPSYPHDSPEVANYPRALCWLTRRPCCQASQAGR